MDYPLRSIEHVRRGELWLLRLHIHIGHIKTTILQGHQTETGFHVFVSPERMKARSFDH